MEYCALFVWLTLCLLVGAAVHYVLAGAMETQLVKLISAPGTIVRKFTMALTALFCGATLTKAKLYELSDRDVDFSADGISSISKALVPLMPLFGCAAVMMVLNAMFLHPFRLDYTPPAISAFDSGGIRASRSALGPSHAGRKAWRKRGLEQPAALRAPGADLQPGPGGCRLL